MKEENAVGTGTHSVVYGVEVWVGVECPFWAGFRYPVREIDPLNHRQLVVTDARQSCRPVKDVGFCVQC